MVVLPEFQKGRDIKSSKGKGQGAALLKMPSRSTNVLDLCIKIIELKYSGMKLDILRCTLC
jgi:hypothetical protein